MKGLNFEERVHPLASWMGPLYEGRLIARLALWGGQFMASRKGGRGKARKTVSATTKKASLQREPIDQPTNEMQARVTFDLVTVRTEMGQAIGRAYRRRPLYETMHAAGAISPDELAALHFYRTAFDRCERSPMKSCLNIDGGGGTRADAAVFSATPSMLDAKRKVRMAEAGLGSVIDTMRAVALEDRTFSDLAMQRYGSRVQDGKAVPKSGRHRQLVQREFHVGLLILTDTVRSLTTRSGVEEIWVFPQDDGTGIIRRGGCAPNGLYRCWGDSVKIDRIMKDLRAMHGSELKFITPERARAALDMADAGRLARLEPEELAP